MQKKIIALAIAAALTAPAMAFAEVTVYGKANLSIDNVNDGAVAPTASTTAKQLTSNNSRLGFKGSEDLGGGLSAIWQMEGTVAMDAGTTGTSLFDRNTWLGLKSADMGSVMLGRNDTAYKSATRRLDVFGDQIANDNRKSLGVSMMGTQGGAGFAHDARLANMVNYVSPKLGGLTLSASTVFGAETSPQPAAPNNAKGRLMSLAGAYEDGPIYAAMAYQSVKVGNTLTGDLGVGGASVAATAAAGDKGDAFKLGGSYKMDAITLGLVYETVSYKVKSTSAESKGSNLYLAGKFSVSNTDAVKASYLARGTTKTTGSTTAAQNKDNLNKATAIAIGYDHAMSKNTTVYASYTKVKQEVTGGADPTDINVGMVYSF